MALVLSLAEIEELRPQLKNVVLLGGGFDIIHGGHIDHLKEAKELGDTLVVHVTSDQRITAKKGAGRPILGQDERAKIVAAIGYVDYVFIADLPHYEPEILHVVKPDILFLNHEAVSKDIKNRLDSLGPQTKVVVSDSAKVNHSSKIVSNIQKKAAT